MAASSRLSKKLRSDVLAVLAMAYIAIMSLMAVLAYAIIPDSSPHANRMELSISKLPPGSSVSVLEIANEEPTYSKWEKLMNGDPHDPSYIPVEKAWRKGDMIFFEPFVKGGQILEMPIDSMNVESVVKADGEFVQKKKFLLGTDIYGRDYLSRLVLGSRISLSVGFISVLISILLGMTLGACAAYFGGWVDDLIMWFINVMWSIPTLLMVIAITLALGKGFWQIFVAVGLTMWVEVARIVRGQVLILREQEFIGAATALGYGHIRTLVRHIIPNTWGPVIVVSAANFAAAILIESGLSFLGVGAQPPIPSWGGMIKDHYAYIIMDKAYLAILPGLAIMLLVLAFMLLGNSLRSALDVRDNV